MKWVYPLPDPKNVADNATNLINEHARQGWHVHSVTPADRGLYVTFLRES